MSTPSFPRRLPSAVLRTLGTWALAAIFSMAGSAPARAQTGNSTAAKSDPTAATSGTANATPAPASAENNTKAQDPKPEEEIAFDPSEPDFTVVTIPTTEQLPRFKSAFRLTHRFARSLSEGDFSDLVSNFFGFDSGAQIGLEYRVSLIRRSQVGIYRTSDKTIEFYGQYNVSHESRSAPVSIQALVSVEGANNFQESYTPALGAVVSKRLKTHGAVYLMPQWVHVADLQASGHGDTLLLGMGARLRIRPTVYVVAEFTPRVAGDSPGVHYGSFGIEKRAGGHVFQLNFSDMLGTTPGQIARGGLQASDWHIGFNLSRKFF